MLNQRIPPVLQPLLQYYTQYIEQEMPRRVAAFYLEGSIALDSFNPRLSDIDFIAILGSRATPEDFEKLTQVHKIIQEQYPKWELSGMYFQSGDLGCLEHANEPFLQYYDRKLQWSKDFGLSSVTWWILKNHGIAVFGPPAQTLNFTVDMDHLIQIQKENLNSYWASWTKRPGRILKLISNWGIQWTVLGILRQFYTIRERQIVSKVKAGEYALTCMPEYWHPLIREAIAIRENPGQSCYRSRLKRATEAFHFLKYTIKCCNEHLGTN